MTRSHTLDPGPSFRNRGKPVRVITDVVTLKASTVDTRDTYSLFDIETPPSGGFPAHIQRHDDMGFYVIEGTYTFLHGEREIALDAGKFLPVPRGTLHGYVNPGPESARMLVVATPGQVQERFIDTVGDTLDRPVWEPDMAHFLKAAPDHGIEFPPTDAAGTQS